MAKTAMDRKEMFNIIHYETGFKIDFIVRKSGTYYEKEFERRKVYRFANKPCFFASPEDTVFFKTSLGKKRRI